MKPRLKAARRASGLGSELRLEFLDHGVPRTPALREAPLDHVEQRAMHRVELASLQLPEAAWLPPKGLSGIFNP